MKVNNLDVVYGTQKSLYGKAKTIQLDNLVSLMSYDTTVCRVDTDRNTVVELNAEHSNTTNRHINEFLKQYGIIDRTYSKKELMEITKNEIR